MPSEKPIQRKWPVYEDRDRIRDASRILGSAWAAHHPDRIFEVIPVEDHLTALGEAEARSVANGKELCRQRNRAEKAEKNLAAEEQHRLEVQRACIAANQKLQTITAGLEAEVGRYREVAAELDEHDRTARMVGCTFVADRLQALLDQAETAGAE